MKIIIANKFHYVAGGPERYMFGLMDYLRFKGHDVIPFAMAYEKNIPSEYDGYFVKPAGGGSESKLNRLEGGLVSKLRIAGRSIYSLEAKNALSRLIDITKPDLLYCLNIANHMSPSIVDGAQSRGIPVVMRVSDYNLVCPSYLCLRDGKVCTQCECAYYRALQYKCIYDSLPATACRVLGMYVHQWMRIYCRVSAFVTPAKSLRDAMVRAGYPAEKIHHITTFVDLNGWEPSYTNDGYMLYFGRLSPEKGIDFLLSAYVEASPEARLILVGDGDEDYVSNLQRSIPSALQDKVTFAGKKTGQELRALVQGARFVVTPSLCLDNAPNVVYESFASGKAVIASALGGLCEQVTPETGILVEPGNVEQLASAISKLDVSPDLAVHLGKQARKFVEENNDVAKHYDSLMNLLNQVVGIDPAEKAP